jgi:hypothetical protein
MVSVVMEITGSKRGQRMFDLVVRCATLLAYAEADRSSSPSPLNANANEQQVDADGGAIPWAEWGPRSTSMSDHRVFEWNDLLGERRATVDHGGDRVRIHDYNPYRIRQARKSGLAKGHHGGGGGLEGRRVDSDLDVEEGNESRRSGSRRITERNRIERGEWFREDVWTALPHLDMMIYKPGCRAIYMEQDQLLLHVDDYLNDVSVLIDDDSFMLC